ncbi:MAG: SDR family oxidoreductase [Nevskiales bacterium]|nr:SDR family oxidoreductase [Nevskiales bacterium]
MAVASPVFAPSLFRGRTVFVAGGTSGINLGIARRFSSLGAALFVVSRSEDKVATAVAELRHSGPADGAVADVRDFDAVQSAIGKCIERFGAIDIAVSGAAGNFVAPAAELSPNGFRTVVDIDLIGSFHVCRAVYPYLRKPGASIINISATQAFTPLPGQVHVCAAKAGIDAMTKVLAVEWGPEGVRVNAIAPGPVDGTEGMARLTPTSEHRERLTQTIPLRRYATLDEIADTAVFLCSSAGANFNGEVLVCDGGQSVLGGGGFAAAWASAAPG